MSLYNMVCGMNVNLTLILSYVLGFRIDHDIPRFRDVFTKKYGGRSTRTCIGV